MDPFQFNLFLNLGLTKEQPLMIKALLLGMSFLAIFSSQAIVIHHEKNDKDYQALGKQYQNTIAMTGNCMATVVDPYWLVTAAHCANPSTKMPVQITHLRKSYAVEAIHAHPSFGRSQDHDLALLQLRWPLENAKPVKLYKRNDELNKLLTIVGNGMYGNGLTGENNFDNKLRAATNTTSSVDDVWLTFIFDEGKNATPLEGVSGTRDSGGPAFISNNKELYLAGVSCCQEPSIIKGKEVQGGYGANEYYTRISTHIQWIEETISNTQITQPPVQAVIDQIKNGASSSAMDSLKIDKRWLQRPKVIIELILQAQYHNNLEFLQLFFNQWPELKATKYLDLPLPAYAYKQGNGELFNMMIDLDFNLDYQGFMGQNYLSLLTWQYPEDDYYQLAKQLIGKGFDINNKDKRGDGALQMAAFIADFERVQFLIRQGADINLQDQNGHSVLMDSARRGNTIFTKQLLALGANPNLTNHEDKTAADIALTFGHNDLAQMLNKAMQQ